MFIAERRTANLAMDNPYRERSFPSNHYPGTKSPNSYHDQEQDDALTGGKNGSMSRRPKTHPCTFEGCGKSFDSKWALVRHVRTHTGEKPFPCEHPGCTKSFAEKSAMTRHLQTHSSAKPYKCHYEGCGKSFKGKEYLEFHLKIHAEGNPYACPHPSCAKTFCSPKSLKKHIRLWHNPGGKSTSVYGPRSFTSVSAANVTLTFHLTDPLDSEQQLRERIIKMTNRNKEKQQKADALVKALTIQIKQLKKEVGALKRRLGEPYESEEEEEDLEGNTPTAPVPFYTTYTSQVPERNGEVPEITTKKQATDEEEDDEEDFEDEDDEEDDEEGEEDMEEEEDETDAVSKPAKRSRRS